ncbi:MAG TPA: AsmA-like C-terminal region-containing protein [Acetobacteraceae bacterium]|nr:AsmA-like C-terminal region-containing protein [Acetobacteraceae bacterium]
MRTAAGQVLGEVRRGCTLLLGLLLVLLLAASAGAWRLSQGPVEVPFLARQIEAESAAEATRLDVGRAEVGWRGWREGRFSPLDVRLSGVRVLDAEGFVRAELPDASLSLSLYWLLRGHLAPTAVEIREPMLRARRDAEGQIALDLGRADASPGADAQPGPSPLEDLLREMMRPASDATPRSALTRLRIVGGSLTVEDAGLGLTWALGDPLIDLRRLPGGGIAAEARAELRLDGEGVPLHATAEVVGEPAEARRFDVAVGPVDLRRLSRAAPALAPLAALSAPARLSVTGRVSPGGRAEDVRASLQAWEGWLDLGADRRIPLAALEAEAGIGATELRLHRAALRLSPTAPDAPAPVLTVEGAARLDGGTWRGVTTLQLDRAPFGTLARWWPAGLADGVRDWMLSNITAGQVRDGAWRIAAEAPAADPAAIQVTSLEGSARAEDATVHWLRPIPPAEGATGTATFSLSEVSLRVAGARQSGTGVAVRDGTVRFAFPPGGVPQADITLGLAGPVADVLAVVAHPRLRLFENRPLPIRDPQGALDGRLTIALPLLADLPVEQVRIRANARLREVRIGDVFLGRPIERGVLDLNVTNEGLRVSGNATLAGIAARLGVEMDFRPGPATQVVMRETVQARAEAAELGALLDLPVEDVARGPVGLDVRTERRRGGQGRVAVRADLRGATMGVDPVAWTKPPGEAAGAEATLRLAGDALEAVEAFRVEAPGMLVRGAAEFGRGSRLTRVTIAEGAIDASRFAAEVRPPAQPGSYWRVVLRGPALDLRRTLAEDTPAATPGAADSQRTPLQVEARFDRVLLGEGREVASVQAQVAMDGRGVLREGRVAGRAGPRGPFEMVIAPAGAGRSVRATADDAGALLAAFGVLRHLEGGRLVVNAAYPTNAPGAPLAGTAEMSDFSVRNAPGFAKLLQAMTLYGLVEAVSGPGLGFSRLVAPFTLTPETLALQEARAFSASLGLTAKGRLDRRRGRLDMEGTIVPAYFFNSLLGNIPILGRMFSPEAGGGVFAATFRVQGPADDPAVTVNPLAALTPGFLRGLFGLGAAQGGGAAP